MPGAKDLEKSAQFGGPSAIQDSNLGCNGLRMLLLRKHGYAATLDQVNNVEHRGGLVLHCRWLGVVARHTPLGGDRSRHVARMRVAAGATAAALVLTVSLAGAGANTSPGWAIQSTPNPVAAKESSLAGISCSSATACIAVGWSATNAAGGGFYQPSRVVLVERWNGANWTLQPAPTPAGAKDSQFTAVSCGSADACTAVGEYRDSAGADVTLAERWNGKDWIIQRTVNPGGAVTVAVLDAALSGSDLDGVACASATNCTAVGQYSTNAGPVALIERWDGSGWRLQPAAGGQARRLLDSVSCAAPSACTAVGATGSDALAERWDGSAWALEQTPSLAPPKATTGGARLLGVSCTSTKACTAVGSKSVNHGSTSVLMPVAERWDGTTWALQKVLVPGSAGQQAYLVGVSCASNAACTAVGVRNPRSGVLVSVVLRWDGFNWAIAQTPSPTGVKIVDLSSVSCTSPTVCFAVGDADAVTLAERLVP